MFLQFSTRNLYPRLMCFGTVRAIQASMTLEILEGGAPSPFVVPIPDYAGVVQYTGMEKDVKAARTS